MLRVRTPSRLHFGLLSLPAEGAAAPSGRLFGGVGLMVRRPGVQVAAGAAASWSAEGPLAERALGFARRVAEGVRRDRPGADGPPLRLRVEEAAPEHAGLGTGTQLGLAVARAVAAAWGVRADARDLARWSGRGLRSALGVHGFERGGLLVEAGKRSPEALAPLVARTDFPEEWRVVLIAPLAERDGASGLHGTDEREAFARLAGTPGGPVRTDALCRLVLLGLLPAIAERDLEAFGEALFEFNQRAGEAFAPVQGGTYAGPKVAAAVAFLRGQGVRGAGQSSWGPTAFAVVGDEERAEDLARRVRDHFRPGPAAVLVTAACNRGAETVLV
jgi:beta-ribofuranosylaminobenzene 5'-phosphate synthase